MSMCHRSIRPSLSLILQALLIFFLCLPSCTTAQDKAVNATAAQEAQKIRNTPQSDDAPDYVLSVGDVVSIKFFYNAELNEQIPIRPDGKIALPLIGDIKAAGATPDKLRIALMDKYGPHLKQPELVVLVTAFDTQKAYVGGEVNRPGIIPLMDRMTAFGALVAAGGVKDTGTRKTVYIIRDQGTSEPLLLMVDLSNNASTLKTDVALRPRDIVYIPMSPIAKADLFVEQYIEKLVPVIKSFNLNYNFGTIKGF